MCENEVKELMIRPCQFAAWILVCVVAAWGTGSAGAHPGESLDLRIAIDDETVRYQLLISADFLQVLMGKADFTYTLKQEGKIFRFTDPQRADQMRAYLRTLLADCCPVRIDGVEVRPLVESLQFYPATVPPGYPQSPYTLPPDLQLVIAYPTKGPPDRVNMIWGLYPQDPSRMMYGLPTATDVVAQLDAHDQNKLVVFAEQEPEFTWHAPQTPIRQRVSPVVVQERPANVRLPVTSILIVAGWGSVALALRLVTPWRKTRWLAATGTVAAGVVAAALYDTAPVRMPWQSSVVLPEAAEAQQIFTSLHRNVYRAFDYKDESDIYDVLAQTVDGPLLDQVYNEVYQSLILRDQGGAVARVKAVDVLDIEVETKGLLPQADAPAFRIRSRWRVAGAVYHWGHVHSRTNEYQARYTVAQRGKQWKIVGVDVLSQERIVQEGDDPGDMPPAGVVKPS